jgi:hypothetical protein
MTETKDGTAFVTETHCHTSETSACSRISGAALTEYYAGRGVDTFIVTDHFFNGNTTVPRHGMSWEERVARFCAGYENAKARADELGIRCLFGWEYSFGGSDLLTYGLDREWLLAHPDVCDWRVSEYCARVRADGAVIVHAHPFREAGYIEMIRLLPRAVDAVETYNACRDENCNAMARVYSGFYALKASAGSDLHAPQDDLGVVLTDERIEDIGAFCKTVLSGPRIARIAADGSLHSAD